VTRVVIQHNSGQFSDTPFEHISDARATFAHAVKVGAWAVTGTESANAPKNHDARDALLHCGAEANFFVFAHPYGEWVALNRRFLKNFDHGYMGPYIPGTHGLDAAHGAHAPRGIAWAQGVAKDGVTGKITVGSTHWNTPAQNKATGQSNSKMAKGSQAFGLRHGRDKDIVFLNGDANERDDATDIFEGGDFLTIADERKDWPKTHGLNTKRGTAIDFIASWTRDNRVSAVDYEVLDDSQLKLFFDHFVLVGTFEIRPLHR